VSPVASLYSVAGLGLYTGGLTPYHWLFRRFSGSKGTTSAVGVLARRDLDLFQRDE
jgi:hypothetical protein